LFAADTTVTFDRSGVKLAFPAPAASTVTAPLTRFFRKMSEWPFPSQATRLEAEEVKAA